MAVNRGELIECLNDLIETCRDGESGFQTAADHVKDTELKAGDYRFSVGSEKVTIDVGKKTVEVPCKIENGDKKFDNTAIRYTQQNGKQIVSEIRVGGTKTRLIFN